MIKLSKLNNIEVKPVVLKDPPKHILGSDMFPLLSCNIEIVAPKNSGKTVVIKNILDECADKDTHVILFVGTHNNDPTWVEIKKDLKKRKIRYSAYTSIFSDQNQNIVDALIESLEEEAGDPDDEFNPEDVPKMTKNFLFAKMFGKEEKEVVEKKPKKKIVSPDYIIIFDDLSNELKNPAIPKLMKIQRHFSSKIIISTQSYINCHADIRRGNLDYILLFQNINNDVLEQIHQELSVQIPLDMFIELYHYATAEKYHFLFYDRNGYFRKDFNKNFEIIR